MLGLFTHYALLPPTPSRFLSIYIPLYYNSFTPTENHTAKKQGSKNLCESYRFMSNALPGFLNLGNRRGLNFLIFML